MCGIIGAVAQRNVTDILVAGLKRLEYRGYDSAGVAVVDETADIGRCRVKGKVDQLGDKLKKSPIMGQVGIAHTRWATHGEPSERNAHPHMSGSDIAVVHNGIIENHDDLRQRLAQLGYKPDSETDSELIAHIIHHQLTEINDLKAAVQATTEWLQGAYALGVMSRNHPNTLIAVRHGSPLVIGLGVGENFIASDQLALLPVTQRFIYLEEGDVAQISEDEVVIHAADNQVVQREIHEVAMTHEETDKGQYRHYMQKEIFQQPQVLADTLEGRLSDEQVLAAILGPKAEPLLPKVERVQIVACGTSYHAGLVASYWLESLARVACDVQVASEFRYRDNVVQPNTLYISISQSGETADTLAALKQAKQNDYLSYLAICNVAASSLIRESELSLMTRAGTEIGVASTKAFTTQLTALLLLTLVIANQRKQLSAKKAKQLVQTLRQLPSSVELLLQQDKAIKKLAKRFADKNHALFLGRGAHYPIALEGALKLKEISYIHAEAYPAGELKHGPLALVDKTMPVIAVAPNDALLEKLSSNLHEVKARGGELIVFADESVQLPEAKGMTVITLPSVPEMIAPIAYTIPLQLLAYHVALIKGTDVDQPRNLAKSVTVE